MMRDLATSLTAILLCCACAFSIRMAAQTAPPPSDAPNVSPPPAQSDGRREFRFISTNRVSTMEGELNTLAVQGFRLERVSKSLLGDDLAVLLTRDAATAATADAARHEYKIISTRRAGTMEREITEAAAQGFEMRGLISLFRPGLNVFVGDETAAVMERPAGQTTRRFEYRMISTRRERTTQRELNEAVAGGFTPVEMVYGQDNGAASLLFGPQFVTTIITGREVNSPAANAPAREYKFLSTTRVGTMEREMNAAAREGYRFFMSAPNMLMLMYRERGEASRAARYEYKLLATQRTGTMQTELLEQGALGYNYLATSSGLGGLTTVLERDLTINPQENRREYKLLATSRERTTQNELVESLAAGYRILDLTTIGEFVIILDRRAEGAGAN